MLCLSWSFAVSAWGSASAEEPRGTLTAPEPIATERASYPKEALAAGKEGTTTILVSIDATGNVISAEVSDSAGDASLDEAARQAALKWRFRPALRDGRAIESQVKIPFHFHAHPAQPAAAPPPEAPPPPAAKAAPAEAPVTGGGPASVEAPAKALPPPEYASSVVGKKAPSRGASDYHVDVENLSLVPQPNAAGYLRLAPGILLTNDGGEGHAEQIFLRGFNAREGQDIEMSVDGVPINEVGNLHGNGYADTHFIIPELVQSLRVIEGPYDPRQTNFAVAGSAEYHLGLPVRGVGAKLTTGSFGTYRLLLTYAPPGQSVGTFVAAELYQTAGYGQNRDGRRASVMGQYEGHTGNSTYRLNAAAFLASFHSAGVIRQDDYESGRIGFYDTYDPGQGEDGQRYAVSGQIETHAGRAVFNNQIFGIARPLRIRENFTGFLLDTQDALESPHGQRGDRIDLSNRAFTVGAKSSGRIGFMIKNQPQDLEIGYFARGDFVHSVQQRQQAANDHPYHTDTDLDSNLGNIGLYLDLNLRFTRWLSLRGGLRGDLFLYEVNDNCAVQSIEQPTPTRPLNDSSCYDQESFGQHREPNQRATTTSAAYLPRASLLVGPFAGLGLTVSVGQGARSIDPIYVTQDQLTPFVKITSSEGGLTFQRRFRDFVDVTARSVVFYTGVERDLIFSQTVGRNTLAGATTRVGSATSLRLTGPFFDLSSSLTYVHATFNDDGLLIPYVPDLVFRADAAVFGELPWKRTYIWHKPLRAAAAAGVNYVAPRPLPYGERSDPIFTLDGNVTVGWWLFDLGLSVTNLTGNRYRLGEYNYASDFGNTSSPTLVPVRHFTAGAPRTVLFSLAIRYGGQR